MAALLVPALMLGWAAIALAQSTPSASEGQEPTVYVRQDPALGSILTDGKGMTLYQFTKDTTKGESSCTDRCAQNWPPFTASEPFSLPFTVKGELSTIQRTEAHARSPTTASRSITSPRTPNRVRPMGRKRAMSGTSCRQMPNLGRAVSRWPRRKQP